MTRARATGLATIAVVSLSAVLGACRHEHAHDHGHDHGAAEPAKPGTNPVQHEMRLLHDAVREAVTAVANGDVKQLPHAFHRVHGAKDATAKAIAAGTWKPPKNGAALDRFRALDEAFHADLEALVGAAQRNDVKGTASALGKTIAGCPTCHGEFRD